MTPNPMLANDLPIRITNAIIRQEGMPADYRNPGNCRTAPWIANPSIVGGFWQPRSRAEGIAGVVHCVALRIAEGQSLHQLITGWAPPGDGNKTAIYIANVAQWTGIPDPNTPLLNLGAA